MISILLSWLYIALICTLIGIGVLSLLKEKYFSLIYYIVAGIIVITVFVEFFSIFAKMGACFYFQPKLAVWAFSAYPMSLT